MTLRLATCAEVEQELVTANPLEEVVAAIEEDEEEDTVASGGIDVPAPGLYVVRENAAGRFEVVGPEGLKIAEATEEIDAQSVASARNSLTIMAAVEPVETTIALVDEVLAEPCQECIDIVAAIPVKPPTSWFEQPELDGPTPITVTSDGQIYGHAAIWGTCHLGNPRGPGVCVEPPRSKSGYELFHLGEVETDDGVRVAVGNITLDTGHAPMGAGARTAAAHYDDTGTVIADVVAGEDEHGLWFAGALRSDVTPETVRKFTGSKISGDWRSNELVGMLCVNVPGFPVPRARARLVADANGNEEVLALVAAGIVGEQPPSEREIEIRVATLCARVEGIDALADLALA